MQRGGQDIVVTDILLPVIGLKRRVVNVKGCHRIEGLRRGFNTGFERRHVNSIMASSTYGRKLNPYRRLRDPLGVKGVRQSVVVTNNPSSIDQNQQLLVRFPNLGAHDVVVPGTARLAFTVSLTSTDANRTIVKNVGRAVVKKTTIKISGNEVLSIDDSDVLHCYQDL